MIDDGPAPRLGAADDVAARRLGVVLPVNAVFETRCTTNAALRPRSAVLFDFLLVPPD